MTFDQAQSPRLGQRTAVESTYVQIVDVTPGNDISDLVEAAWPGMLVFRNDLSQLQIFDPAVGGWRSIAGGGAAGQISYVGTDMPTGTDFNVGDTWYDSDDNYKAYVWNGTEWKVSTGPAGNKTYYETGFILNPAFDPEIPADPLTNPYNLWVPLTPARVNVTAFTIGDIWYQTDDSNHPYRWGVNEGVTEWYDIINPAISQTGDNTIAISELDSRVKENTYLATSANNTADTADGRVSMSDYMPGADDVTYDQKQTTFDPETGVISEITVQVPRQNGSIWYTRTRPRLNMCKNPSLETNQDDWAGIYATIERHDHHEVPAGDWTLHVTNVAGPEHGVSYGVTNQVPCKPGLDYACSVYAEQLTVLPAGVTVSVTLQIIWCDATGTQLPDGYTIGDPYTLVVDAFTPGTLGTQAEPRVWVKGTAPAGAVSFYVREICSDVPEAVGLEWHTGAMLVEQEDDLGRYFDGDSYDGYWGENRDNPGVAHSSVSGLIGDKIQEIWELRDSIWIQKYLTAPTIKEVFAETIVGQIDRPQLGTGVVSPDKHTAMVVKASEALLPGEIVHIWNEAGEHKVRRADALNRYEAHGFVWDGAAIGTSVAVYHTGYIEGRDNLAPGLQWLSPYPGQVTNQPPSEAGSIVQRIGFSPKPDTLNFQPGPAIRIT